MIAITSNIWIKLPTEPTIPNSHRTNKITINVDMMSMIYPPLYYLILVFFHLLCLFFACFSSRDYIIGIVPCSSTSIWMVWDADA